MRDTDEIRTRVILAGQPGATAGKIEQTSAPGGKPDQPAAPARKPDPRGRPPRSHRKHRPPRGEQRPPRGEQRPARREQRPGEPRNPRPHKRVTDRVVIRGDDVNVGEIMAAVKARVRRRKLTLEPAAAGAQLKEQIDRLIEAASLGSSVAKSEIANTLEPQSEWNIDGAFQIPSHRKLLGPFIVFAKRVSATFTRLLARPIVTRQAEINRNQAVILRETVRELARQNIELKSLVDRLETVLKRVGADSGSTEPLVVFDDRESGARRPHPRHRRPQGRAHQRQQAAREES